MIRIPFLATNAAGQITKITYGNGVVTDYSYNPQTLRLNHLASDGPAGRLQDFSYAFDSVGNVTGITDAVHTGTQTFQYDSLNRLTRAAGAYGTMTYAYNAIGNMLEKEGVAMAYGERGAGPHAVTSVSSSAIGSSALQLTYDANGNLLEKSPTADSLQLTAQAFSYDAENRLTKVDTAQEDIESVTFKPGWNFFSLPVIPADAHISALFPNFSRDFEQIAKFVPASNFQPPTSEHFEQYVGNAKFDDFSTLDYGVGYQIYCKSASDVTISLKGKLPTKKLSKSLAAGWQLLPSLGLTAQTISQAFSGVTTTDVRGYTNGSLASTTQTSPGQAYWVNISSTSTWSPPLPKNVTTSFVYDGDEGKVKQITASGTTTYLGEVYEKDPAAKTTKYVFAGSLRLAAKDSTGALRFYHTDHLGSSDVITDGTGAVVEHTEHTPYGSVAVASSLEPQASSPKIGFTGQRQDAGTGLILFPARVYDPQLGRFIQADPFVQEPGDPQSLNRYSYVRNNPINLVDPSGHFFFAAIFAAIIEFVVAHAGEIAVAVATTAAAAVISNRQARSDANQPSPSAPVAAPPLTLGQRWNNFATDPRVSSTASLVAGFVPGAGETQDFWAARYGMDVFTNEQIPWGWRLGAGVALFIPAVGIVQVRHGARALNEEVSKGAKYVYDASVKRYRHASSGRFVAGRNLPFPANEGFRIRNLGTLKPGKMIDRYGSPHGGYASDVGASISSRGLPPGSEALEYHRYEVVRPLDVDMGPAAAVPDFAATGGTTQYRFGRPISELVEEGSLRER